MIQHEKPKVSVCVITYNHAQYIRQCLQSIVDQEIEFPFEVIVGDDCSNDGTQAIVQEFAARYPRVVRPLFHAAHIGGTRNLILVYEQAIGELIAHMDGDDYMLPGKLRLQVEALDDNPDCTMCVHAMQHLDQATGRYREPYAMRIPRKGDITFLLMHFPYFAHSSKMYRTECRDGLETGTAELLDCYFHVHHAMRGKILYLPQQLGVYRMNVGVSTAKTDAPVDWVPTMGVVDLAIDAIEYAGRRGVAAELVVRAKAQYYYSVAYSYLLAKDFKMFRMLIKRSYDTAKVSNKQRVCQWLSGVPRLLHLLVRARAGLRVKRS